MAVLADTMPTEQLGVAMGTVGSVVSLGMVSAPVIGGAVFHKLGYEAVFWVFGGMLFIDFLLRLMMIERKDAKQWDIASGSETEDESTGLLGKFKLRIRCKIHDYDDSRTLLLVLTNEVSTVSDSVMDGVYQFYDPGWSIRCCPSTSSQTNIQLYCINIRGHVCGSRYSRNGSWTCGRLDSRPLRT